MADGQNIQPGSNPLDSQNTNIQPATGGSPAYTPGYPPTNANAGYGYGYAPGGGYGGGPPSTYGQFGGAGGGRVHGGRPTSDCGGMKGLVICGIVCCALFVITIIVVMIVLFASATST